MNMLVKNSADLNLRYFSCCNEKLNCFGGVNWDLKFACFTFD